eukprot:Em0003g427a
MNITICDRCNAQLQIPLIDEINLRQHQQSKSCKAIAAKVKASASQPKITSLLRHVFASPAASDACQQVSAEQINKFAISKDEYVGGLGKELTAKKLKEEFLLLKTDMLMEPRISCFGGS